MPVAQLSQTIDIARGQLGLMFRISQGDENLSPPLTLEVETKRYRLSVARTKAELLGALRLRYRVFYRELAGRWFSIPPGLDVDQFDLEADHIVITERASEQVIGTYRLLCSKFHRGFYSATEFGLAPLIGLPGVKLELGRACVDPKHRNGVVIGLLWRGIADYARLSGADYLFGCSSLKTMNPAEIASIMSYLDRAGHIHPELKISALPEFAAHLPRTATASDLKTAELLPSLFLSYLKAGAKVCSEPAIDRAFRCTDLLTFLPTAELAGLFSRRYEVA